MNEYYPLGIVFAVLLLGAIILIPFATKEAPDPVLERVQREVHLEFEPLLVGTTGMRRWWLLYRREREVSRRMSRLIYADSSQP